MTDIVKRLRGLAAVDNCQASLEAADEITRLRNELHIMEVWSSRIIAGTQQDVIEIARLRAEVKRLKAVEADYDLHELEMIDLEEDNGRLTADNEKLRAALKTILDLTDYGTETATWRMTNTNHNANVIARAALEGTKHD